MEYLIGSLVTFIVGYFVFRVAKQEEYVDLKSITYSQSHINNLIDPFLPTNDEIRRIIPLKTQAKKYLDEIYINVIVFEGKAYWIKDNTLFTAEADGATILKETATKVDTMAMDKVELDRMAFIVDLLTKGKQ